MWYINLFEDHPHIQLHLKVFWKYNTMADENDSRIEPSKAEDGVNVAQVEESTIGPVVKVDSYRDEHHINLTWRSWMVVL